MKQRIFFLVAIILGVLVSLTASDSRVEAQNQVRVVGDTGIITLGPNQTLRVAADPDRDTDAADFLVFRRISYTQNSCTGGLCKYAASGQTTSAPIQLGPGEAVAFQVGPNIQGNGV